METVSRESVRVAVLNSEGRVLLLRAVLPEEEWWELPGGGIEPSETPRQAALRELREETGIGIEAFEADLGTVDTEFFFNGRRHLQRESVFLARSRGVPVELAKPDPPPAARHVEFRWWTRAELIETDSQVHPPQLAELLEPT